MTSRMHLELELGRNGTPDYRRWTHGTYDTDMGADTDTCHRRRFVTQGRRYGNVTRTDRRRHRHLDPWGLLYRCSFDGMGRIPER